jgi:hypothetical protein
MTEKMRIRRESLQDLFNLVLKILLVLMMPVVILVYSEAGTSEVFISNFLHHPLWPLYGGGVNPYPSIWAWAGLIPILLPGVWFAWSLPRRPLKNKVWKSAVASIGLTVIMDFLVVSVMSSFMHGAELFWENYWNVYVLETILTPSIAVLILLPLLMREMRILSVPRDLRLSNARRIDDLPSDNLGRNRVLTVLLWMSFVLMPLILGLSIDLSSGLLSSLSEGIFYAFEFVYYTSTMPPTYSYSVFGMVALASSQFLLLLLLSSVRLVFLRNVFGHLRGTVTRKRLLRIGVVGELLPAAVVALPTFLGGFIGFFQTPVPFPAALLVGFLFIRYFRVSDEIEAFKMKGGEIVSGPVDIEVPEMPDTIKVPVIYVLKSKISSLVRRRQDQQ